MPTCIEIEYKDKKIVFINLTINSMSLNQTMNIVFTLCKLTILITYKLI